MAGSSKMWTIAEVGISLIVKEAILAELFNSVSTSLAYALLSRQHEKYSRRFLLDFSSYIF